MKGLEGWWEDERFALWDAILGERIPEE